MSDNDVNVNPSWKGVGTVSSTVIRNITALSSQMAYSAQFGGNTTVLSSRYAAATNGVISGLLYVPDLPDGDPCIYEAASHVPASVVRQANLPPTNFHLIAIAPWISGRCASAYMAAATTDPARAFLFYMPGNASAPPPDADDSDWDIDDSDSWKAKTNLPVYAMSGIVGETMMQHLSLYSGNMTEVPFGHNITERYMSDTEDYLRIWTELNISTPSAAFNTWVYFLIILGVLLTVITTTSLLMHFAQARRRMALRRRVIKGEVNLEAMGITRLTVSLAHIQKFPLYTYHYEPDLSSPPLSPRSVKTTRSHARTRSLDQVESATASRPARSATVSEFGLGSPFAASHAATDYQPTCEICLEPYENRATVIRELPCGHIFHPECIDEFLAEVSSLCPICKASMLPQGHCPKITNSMVRREYAIRRLRGQIDDQDDGEAPERGGGDPGTLKTWWTATKSLLFSTDNRATAAGPMSSTSTELQESKPRRQQTINNLPPPPPLPADAQGGEPTALARDRMRELAGFEPDYGEIGRTRWQRARTRIFPGF
ncbi:hypothetical protein C8A05DRAFT_42208 [Staphylotrichum tortipilum]|uniref:RING-type domain-containing protein n=1 Tax=Staphylotrichum tortipilum TaxID=2831512 RepID=A0AAN6MQU0_9PEZI|nr:hypothetical protein C8A05DRAFT_42208 [Staphylotrichum longicolle]